MSFRLYRDTVFILTLLAAGGISVSAQAAPANMTFEGQMASLVGEFREKWQKDPKSRGQKLRLKQRADKDLPKEGSFQARIEQELTARLDDLFDQNASLMISIEYRTVVASTGTNEKLQIVTLELLSPIGAFNREINNSGDIARVTGLTIANKDDDSFEERNKEVRKSVEKPRFDTHPARRTGVIAVGQPRYAVELRKLVGGVSQVVDIENMGGRALAPIAIGEAYEIVLLNYDDKCDAVAKVEVDGLDVANTFCIDKDGMGKPANYPGYMIPKARDGSPGRHVVPGWLRTVGDGRENVLQFSVTELGKGAETARKPRSSIGMIHVRFYEAALTVEGLRPRSFGETTTGKGLQVSYALENRVLSTEPQSSITIRYNHGLPPEPANP
jgi:hypothetical protein